jgi:hypothetical protein
VFTAHWTVRAVADYEKIRDDAKKSLDARKLNPSLKATKAEGLFKQTRKCIELLLANPRHPGLKTHKFSSLEHPWDSKQDVFEAYIQNKTPGAYRLFWCYGPAAGTITLIAITPHP